MHAVRSNIYVILYITYPYFHFLNFYFVWFDKTKTLLSIYSNFISDRLGLRCLRVPQKRWSQSWSSKTHLWGNIRAEEAVRGSVLGSNEPRYKRTSCQVRRLSKKQVRSCQSSWFTTALTHSSTCVGRYQRGFYCRDAQDPKVWHYYGGRGQVHQVRSFYTITHLFTATDAASAFLVEIVRLHGFPKSIVSDRDQVFVSQFWRALFMQPSTTEYSSSYYPQTDG